MMKKIFNQIPYFLVMILISSILFLPSLVFAAYNFMDNSGIKTTAEATGHTEQRYFTGQEGDIETGIQTILSVVLSFLGVIFLVLMIYGGVLWMTARGNEKQVEEAKNIILDSIIGLIIVASAYAISYFVLGTFVENSGLVTDSPEFPN